jgi:hypothetical protein
MHRKFIALIIAAATAIAGFAASAAPARADAEDVAKALAGIAALVIIGKAIEDRNDRRDRGHVTQNYHRPLPQVTPRPLPPQVQRKFLPASCLRSVQTRRGEQSFFGARCLQQNYRHANRLPQACSVQVPTQRGWRYGYDPRCLRQSGYRIARG